MNLERDISWYAEGERDADFLQYLIDELIVAYEAQRGTIEHQTNIIVNLYENPKQLQCCGNCKHSDWKGHVRLCYAGDATETALNIKPADECHFPTSHWEALGD